MDENEKKTKEYPIYSKKTAEYPTIFRKEGELIQIESWDPGTIIYSGGDND